MKIIKGNNSIHRRLMRWVSSWQFLVLVGIILCLGLHTYTVADIIKAPPSENFSREIKIGEVEYGYSQFSRGHMTAALSDEQDRVGLFVVDGARSKLYMLDTKGRVLEEISLALDLYNASNIKGYFSNKSEFTILYKTDTLYSAVIDIHSGNFTNEKQIDSLEEFDNEGSLVVFLKEDGLYGLNADTPELGESLILDGDIVSYSVCEDEDLLYIMSMKTNHGSYFDGHLMILNKSFDIISDYTIFSDTNDQLLKEIKDVYYKDGILTSIFIKDDRKGGINNLTTLQVDTNSGKELDRFTKSFARFSGKRFIVDASIGAVSVIMQEKVINGVNLVKKTIENNEIITEPLTKTRGLSALPVYLETNGNQILMFSDLKDEFREINFATSDPKIILDTSSYKTVNFLLVSSTSIALFLVAAFASIPVAIGVVAIPALVLVILNKITKKYKYKNIVQVGVAALIHVVIKVYATATRMIKNPADLPIQPKYFGNEPNIYILLVISSLFSLLCTYRYMKHKEDYITAKAYTFFAIVDMSFYAFTVLAYLFASELIHKIY